MAIAGIDLGTTNSLVGINGKLVSGLVSSNVDVSKGVQAGRDVISKDIVSSYKTNMSMSSDGELSRKCSTIILKTLKEICENNSGEKVTEAVISVPAYFSTSQREAVLEAAEGAGLTVKRLINEPTAAALYICKDIKDLVVVYDLGGGTFDVSIVDSRLGDYSVIATDGIVLGGDNLDEEIKNDIINVCKIPLRLQTAINKKKLKVLARQLKESIQRAGGNSVKVDYVLEELPNTPYELTVDKYKKMIKKVFGQTFEMTNYLISQYIPMGEIPKVVYVGGSSNCPYLKDMLEEEVALDRVEYDVAPDYVVALGATIYAELLDKGEAFEIVEDVTKRLCIEDKDGRAVTIIESNTIIPCTASIVVSNPVDTNVLTLKLYQGDAIVAKKNDYVGTLVFNYEEEVLAGMGIVEVTVNVSQDGIIELSAYEVLYGEETKQDIKLTSR